MSAPDTNVERQARRHKPSLWGIAIAIAVAAIVAAVALLSSGVPGEDQAAGVPAATSASQ